jgi:hypothetical protein
VTEAKIWLADTEPHHISRHMPRKLMQLRVDQIYQTGAKKVYAAGIDSVGIDDFISHLLIELSDDADARKAVVKMADAMNHEQTPTKDGGRKFIVVPMD